MKTFYFRTVMLLGLCLFFKSSFSQNISWIRQQGNNPVLGNDNASAIDAAGNIYVTGTTPDPGYFDDVTVNIGQPDNNVFVAKYSPAGDIIWAKSYGTHENDMAFDIAADADGFTYIVGHYTENITFGPYTLTNLGSRDAFIVKSDPDGNVVWAHSIENISSVHAFAVCLTDTSLYITGDVLGTSSYNGHDIPLANNGAFLLKLNTSGEFTWAKIIATDTCTSLDLKNDAVGNLYMAGYFQGESVDVGDVTFHSSGYRSVFVTKLTSEGEVVWANTIACNTGDESQARALTLNDENDVYITGYFSGSLYFDTTELVAADNDIFIAKYDNDGNLLWAKNAGGTGKDDSYAIEKNATGGVYIAASCDAEADAYFGSIMLPASSAEFMTVAGYLSDGTAYSARAYSDIVANHILFINDSTIIISAHLDSALAGTVYDDVSLAYTNRAGLLMQFHDNNYLCYQPDGLYSDAISDISAIIHWDAVPNADAYMVYYFPVPGDTLSQISMSTDATISGLTPETNYAYYVRSLCSFSAGDTINGENSDLYTFSTTAVAVNEISEMRFNIYPNPNDGNFTIEFAQAGNYDVRISDITGRIVYSVNDLQPGNKTIQINAASGIYDLQIISDNYTSSRKVIIR